MRQSGFELLEFELQLRGTLSSAQDSQGNQRPALTVAVTGQRFLLHTGNTEAERTAFAQLSEWIGDSLHEVEVVGRAHAHRGGDPGLSVLEFRLLE